MNDEITIIETVNNVGTYTDMHEWKKLSKVFADEVLLDYSSFTGQAAERLAANTIIARWEGFLPGFDITQHKITDHQIKRRGDTINVHANVRAFHYIPAVVGGDAWIVDGSYDFTLTEKGKQFEVTVMTFNFEKTIGNNALPGIAAERAAFNKLRKNIVAEVAVINNASAWDKPENPVPAGLVDNPNVKVVQSFFTAYGNNDLAGIRDVMAADVEWFIPGRHKLSGTKKGIEQVVAFFSLLQQAKFKAEPLIFAANDHYVIDAHRGWSTSGEDDIDMNWVLLYKIENGKIQKVINFTADAYTSDPFFDKIYSFADADKLRSQ